LENYGLAIIEMRNSFMTKLYLINLSNYNIKKNYDQICSFVSRNFGWMNLNSGVFDSVVTRDFCEKELKQFIKC